MIQTLCNKNDLMIQLFVCVDDLLHDIQGKEGVKKGRKPKMQASEVITCVIFGLLTGYKTIKHLYRDLVSYHAHSFDLPVYKNFVQAVNTYAQDAVILLSAIIHNNRIHALGSKKFIDATSIAVCNNKRIFDHKVAQGFAQRGVSTMGYFFGFKLHTIVDQQGHLLSFSISPGNTDDRKVVKTMTKKLTGTLIADAGYVSEELREKLSHTGVLLLTGYRKNMKKLVTHGYIKLMKLRQIVETGFGMMKSGGNLVSSYARSLNGHLSRIVYNLLAYSFRRMASQLTLPIS